LTKKIALSSLKNYTVSLELDIKAFTPEQALEKFEVNIINGNYEKDDICIVFDDNIKKLSFKGDQPKEGT
jgi:hypothetical protein